MDKLGKYPAQTFWRSNSPTHFGGATGTFTAVEEVRLPFNESNIEAAQTLAAHI